MPSDALQIVYEILAFHVYDPKGILDGISNNLEHTINIIDAGAHAGPFSIYAFSQTKGKRRILTIESHPRNYEYLLANVLANNLEESIIPQNRAVWIRDNQKAAIVESSWSGGHEVKNAKEDSLQTVKTLSLNSAVNYFNERIDFLKMDIEGQEKNIFHKNTEWLDYVDAISVEYHGPMVGRVIERILLSRGFSVFKVRHKNVRNSLKILYEPSLKLPFSPLQVLAKITILTSLLHHDSQCGVLIGVRKNKPRT